jgi:hypothetical protein
LSYSSLTVGSKPDFSKHFLSNIHYLYASVHTITGANRNEIRLHS